MGLGNRIQRAVGRLVLRALYDLHPELLDRQPLLRIYSDDEGAGLAGGFKSAADYYSANVWVNRAVRLVASTIAPLPLVIQDRDGSTIEDHEIIELFQYVSDSMDSIHLWTQWATDMQLGGESGFELVKDTRGRFREIWPRQPQQITIRVDKVSRRYGGILEYRIEDGYGAPYSIPPDEFIFFKFYNPLNPWRGLSPIQAVRMGILIDEYARAWSRMFFKGSARPDVGIIAPAGLTRTEREEIERRFMEQYGGLENAHRPIVLEQGVTDIKPISYPPKDIEWLEQRKFSREEIAAVFGVPDEIMGFGRDTYENFETAMRAFWSFTLIPIIRSRDATLTEFFRNVGLLKPGQRIITDLSDVDVLREDKAKKVDMAFRLWQMSVPVNDALRYAEVDIAPLKGGNVGYAGINLVPVTSSGEGADAGKGLAPPVTTKAAVPVFGSAEHERIWKAKAGRVDRFFDELVRRLARAFQRQQNEINRRLRSSRALGRARAKGNSTAAEELVKQNINDIFDPVQQAEQWREEFRPLFEEALREAGLAELADLGLDIAFDLNRPEAQAVLRHILDQFARKVNDTTYNDLVDLFARAEEEGWGVPQIMEELSAYWDGRKSLWSRERIARTTMTSVQNAADEVAWGQTDGLVIGSRWLAALDERTRAAHVEAHGQIRRLGEQFYVGGEYLAYPGDPNGSPENIINCRCTRVAVLRGEEGEL